MTSHCGFARQAPDICIKFVGKEFSQDTCSYQHGAERWGALTGSKVKRTVAPVGTHIHVSL